VQQFHHDDLIPPEEFQPARDGAEAGKAYGRALAYLAHNYLGDVFGTVYDISTIMILWFAGASAMAGLLNVVPRYLPRYGMAPDWARATRPLVLIFTAICFAVTIYFRAGVNAQGAAYATGVLALMTSATIAVTLSARRKGQVTATWAFGLVTAIFIYTTFVNIRTQPDGLKIAFFFIAAIVVVSLLSRIFRTTELRVDAWNWMRTHGAYPGSRRPVGDACASWPTSGNRATHANTPSKKIASVRTATFRRRSRFCSWRSRSSTLPTFQERCACAAWM
jgi:hypothetical protein